MKNQHYGLLGLSDAQPPGLIGGARSNEQKRADVIEKWINDNPSFVNKMKELTKDQLVFLIIKDLVGGAYDKALAESEFDNHLLVRYKAHITLSKKLLAGNTEEKHEALDTWEAEMLSIAGNNLNAAVNIARIAGSTRSRIETLSMVRAVRAQGKGLKNAQTIGANANKAYAAESNRLIEQLNADLLGHITTARWGIKERASHIEKKLIEIDRKQTNGKPYSHGTISKKITGKR